MSQASYSIYLDDPFGQRLAEIARYTRLEYSRVVNNVGTLVLTIPAPFDRTLIRAPDGRIELWRRLPGGREYLETDTIWLIKKVIEDLDTEGRETIIIEADTPLCIAREPGRIVDYFSDTIYTRKTAAADDLIKALMRENFGTLAVNGNRNMSAILGIDPDLSLGVSLSKAYAWDAILDTMQEIAATSAQNGVYMAFDIVATTPTDLVFRTFAGQRGTDNRFPGGLNPVIIGPAYGNAGATTRTRDYRDETTYVRTGGPGEGSARLIGSAQDDDRIGVSPFGRRERFVNAAQSEATTADLDNEAAAAVRAGRYRETIEMEILSVPGSRYGVEWGWGDFVTVEAFGIQQDARIDGIQVTYQDGVETITARVRIEL